MVNKMLYHSEAARLFLDHPDEYFTAADISRALGMPYATAWRYVRLLEGVGIVQERRVGRAWACRLNRGSPSLGRMEALLRGAAGDSPHMVVAKEFVRRARKLYNVKRIVLFGSVSRGEERAGSDVDLVVVPKRTGKNAEDAIGDITVDIIGKSGIALTPLVMSEKELKEDRQFENEIKNGVVMYDRGAEGREGGRVLAGGGKVPHGKRR